jgi:hypothetical protein
MITCDALKMNWQASTQVCFEVLFHFPLVGLRKTKEAFSHVGMLHDRDSNHEPKGQKCRL